MTQLNWPTLAEEISRGTVRDPLQHFRPRQRAQLPALRLHRLFPERRPAPGSALPELRLEGTRPDHCALSEAQRLDPRDKRVLHFSAERPFFHQWKRNPNYVAGDIKKSAVANAVVDITALHLSRQRVRRHRLQSRA